MIKSLFIANRGEIACRIIKTANALGIKTIVGYSDADKKALHVRLADVACYLGGSEARESYLNQDIVLEAAKNAGAEALHPGYGFLSENAEFAKKCEKAGIVFVGPPASAIAKMGSKEEAKALMKKAGVPVIPGYDEDNRKFDTFQKKAEELGYPVLLKPAAGGGGKGMRRVEKKEDLKEAIAAARREAMSSFGDDHLLLEKFLENPRHIEVQVFADTKGNTISIYERDCSVQRRHQKVIEEAPAFGLSEEEREKLGDLAVASAKAVGYVGAGTVEFLRDKHGGIYFMEMNTRLQVEHPVTEEITGIDLVEWQLVVASGKALPQKKVSFSGHALEARLYAEDSYNNFTPSVGKLVYVDPPQAARFDTGYYGGDAVSSFYDPMIAKMIVKGRDRKEAISKLKTALTNCHVVGVETNIPFLQAILENKNFKEEHVDTGLGETLLPLKEPEVVPEALALATVLFLKKEQQNRRCEKDLFSPWEHKVNWRLGPILYTTVAINFRGEEYEVSYSATAGKFEVHFSGKVYEITFSGEKSGKINGAYFSVSPYFYGRSQALYYEGERYVFEKVDKLDAEGAGAFEQGSLSAPLPGKVVALYVKEGADVSEGDPLVIIEAMKMEHLLKASVSGTVEKIYCKEGEVVREGTQLIKIDTGESSESPQKGKTG